jgi:hypothetical protein
VAPAAVVILVPAGGLSLKKFRLVAALAAAFPVMASAQGPEPGAFTPDASTPLTYRSAFQDLPAGVEETAVDWKKANAEVARFARGHADWLRWEEQQGMSTPTAPAAGAAPVPGKAPDPAATPAGAEGRKP